MSLVDAGYYEQQRRGYEDQYAASMASNAFSRTLGKTRGDRDLSFMRQDFGRQTPGRMASFAQRGMGATSGVRSGVMQRSMQNWLGDFTTQYGQAQNDLNEQLRQFDLQAAQYGASYNSSLADLALQKQRDIALAASNINALRQNLGGL